ncbi:MAG: helix-turn-helix domain-containing protein [Bacteroidetes bacterium]|nr:helix-turn-helix domain-containing protein [Bacteroidota bacterium]
MNAQLKKLMKPIRTRKDYRAALSALEHHFDAKPGTSEGNLVEILAILIEKYEEEKFPIDTPTPIEAIRFRMEQMGWTNRDLALVLGSRSRASEVLNEKRSLSLPMIRSVHRRMGVPAESLIGA